MNKNQIILKQLLPLLMVIFIDTVGYFIVIPVIMHIFIHNQVGLLPAASSMALRNFYYSLTLMLSPLAFIICSPLIGHFSDRYGRKLALTSALIAACIGFFLPIIGIIKKSIALILIGRLIAGASSSSQPVAQAGITDFSHGKQRAMYLSLIGAAMTAGMIVGPIVGSLFSLQNITAPYWFAFILSVANVLLLAIFYQNRTQTSPQAFHSPLYYLQLLLKNRIWALMLCFFGFEIAWAQYYQSVFLTLDEEFHYTIVKVTIFTAYIGFWMALGLSVIYKLLIKKFNIEKILLYSLITTTIALALCNISSMTAQWILMIPATICIGTAYPSALHIMSHRSDSTHQGYVLGAASTFLGAAWMLTGLISGSLVATWFGLPNLVASIAMLISLCVALAFGRLTTTAPAH